MVRSLSYYYRRPNLDLRKWGQATFVKIFNEPTPPRDVSDFLHAKPAHAACAALHPALPLNHSWLFSACQAPAPSIGQPFTDNACIRDR